MPDGSNRCTYEQRTAIFANAHIQPRIEIKKGHRMKEDGKADRDSAIALFNRQELVRNKEERESQKGKLVNADKHCPFLRTIMAMVQLFACI